MRSRQLLFQGTHRAVGFLIDPTVLGQEEAERRVMAYWRIGAGLFLLPNGQWLFLLAEPVDISTAKAPGALACGVETGCVAGPNLPSQLGQFGWWQAGVETYVAVDGLDKLDPALWLDLGSPVLEFAPLVTVEEVRVTEPTPPPPSTDFRRSAKVGARSKAAAQFTVEMRRPARSSRIQRGRSSTTGSASSQRFGQDWLAKIALRSPLKNEIGRRHQRYLENLTQQFTSGDYSEALRNAIGLGGLSQGQLTLRLPSRRAGLELSTTNSSGGGSVPFDPTVRQHLHALYLKAAEDLEAAGQVDEAAFVHSELMNQVGSCIALLERHRRFRQAAGLAENRSHDPALAVRLWWLAGDRERALRLARRHHAYATVLSRLAATDPELEHEFRLHWVNELEQSGDVLGAIQAGWPDRQIRPLLANLIERGIDAAGDCEAALHPYRVALRPSVSNLADLSEFLDSTPTKASRMRMVAVASAEAQCSDPTADREIASQILRALTLVPRSRKDKGFNEAYRRIKDRADPVLAADLPRFSVPEPTRVMVTVPDQPQGLLPILDAVPLQDGKSLVALGELGCRLLTSDGRTITHWDIPTHHLVSADHGGSVLLLTRRDEILEVHHLDLSTRKSRRYGRVRSVMWAESFDGKSWVALDERGLAFLDLFADGPEVSWRLLEQDWTCYRVARSEAGLTVVVSVPATTEREWEVFLMRWELPSQRLTVRRRIEFSDPSVSLELLSDATAIWGFDPDSETPSMVVTPTVQEPLKLDATNEFRTSGEYLGCRDETGMVSVTLGHDGKDLARMAVEGQGWGIRVHAGRVAIWDQTGRLGIVDLAESELITAVRVLT